MVLFVNTWSNSAHIGDISSSSSSNLFSSCTIHIFTKKVYICIQSVVSHHSHELLQLIYYTFIEYYN